MLLFVSRSDWHLNRNKHNRLPLGKLTHQKDGKFTDETGLIWELQPNFKNKLHQPDRKTENVNNPYPNVIGELTLDLENPNLKFLCKNETNQSCEAILQPNGKYLTKGSKQGTYNYSHPSGFFGNIKHFFLDVMPHFVNRRYRN